MKNIFILLFALNITPSLAQDLTEIKWEELSAKEGITVFKPLNYKHPSGLVPIRFKATLKHNISKILTVFADDKTKIKWVPKAKEMRLVERTSPSEFIGYYKYHAPWPFQDRDFLMHNKGVFDRKTMTVSVKFKAVTHEKEPPKPGITRGTTHTGYSIIKPISENETFVEMAFLTEFGGNIPTWIINMIQKKWPYGFMTNLRKYLSENEVKINPAYTLKGK